MSDVLDPAFWHERWESNRIGFHQDRVNPFLERHWDSLNLPAESGVFVPLCGKSLDMIWLRDRGHPVLGVELSPIAIEVFFSENGMTPVKTDGNSLPGSIAEHVTLLCGDVFELASTDTVGYAGVYDRASLITFPPHARNRYADLLTSIFPTGSQALLVTLDYPQDEMSGPPFSVPEAEVRALFSPSWDVQRLESPDVLEENERFVRQGVSRLHECVFRLVHQ